jgi:hypothetical protein
VSIRDLFDQGQPDPAHPATAWGSKVSDALDGTLTLEQFGGVADGFRINSVEAVQGSTTLTTRATFPVSTRKFTPDMVGKTIVVAGAGAGGFAPHVTTVAAFVSEDEITMAAAAVTSRTGSGCAGGTDNGPAMQAILDEMGTADVQRRVLFGPGRYFLGTPAARNFAEDRTRDLVFEGQGYATQLIISPTGSATGQRMIDIVQARQVRFDRVTFIGAQAHPWRSVIRTEVGRVAFRDCMFYGLRAEDNGGILTLRQGSVIVDNCHFFGCSGDSGQQFTSAIFLDNWTNAIVRRCEFIDHGWYDGFTFLSAGGRAWIIANNPAGDGTAMHNPGVLSFEHLQMDEATHRQIEVTGTGTNRTRRVNLFNVRCNASDPGGTTPAFDISKSDHVTFDQCWVGWRNTSAPAVRLNDAGTVEMRRCDFDVTNTNIVQVDSETRLLVDDSQWGSLSGTPGLLVRREDGVFVENYGPVFSAGGDLWRLTVDGVGAVSTQRLSGFTLTTNVVGDGTVTRDPDKPFYDENEQVTVEAVPGEGSTFEGWSGDLTGTTNPDTVTMDASKVVTASFDDGSLGPDSVAGLFMWLDADNITGLTQDQNVAAWPDASGNSHQMLAVGSGRGPKFQPSSVNGRAAVKFNRANTEGMRTEPFATAVAQPVTYFLAFSFDETVQTQRIFDGDSGSGRHSLQALTTGVTTSTDKRYLASAGTNLYSPGDSTNGTFAVYTLVFNGASSSLRRNGVPLVSGAAGTNTMNRVVLGQELGNVYHLEGLMGSFLMYEGALSTADRDLVEGWLMDKYGIV